MRTLGFVVLVLIMVVAASVSCTGRREAPKLPVQQGWVPADRVEACLGSMLHAPMPVHYLMPLDEALEVLGRPHGTLKDLQFLRNFPRTKGTRAYCWHAGASTLYLVYDRTSRLVQTLIVVDDVSNMGVEILLTREEILSARIKPGMSVGEVYRIMGKPDRIEVSQTERREPIDRFWYEPPPDLAPPIYIEIDRATLKVIYVSTAPTPETGPPPDGE